VEPEVDAASGARSHRNDPSVRRSCLAASRSARAHSLNSSFYLHISFLNVAFS
jgi:hypothetical protein